LNRSGPRVRDFSRSHIPVRPQKSSGRLSETRTSYRSWPGSPSRPPSNFPVRPQGRRGSSVPKTAARKRPLVVVRHIFPPLTWNRDSHLRFAHQAIRANPAPQSKAFAKPRNLSPLVLDRFHGAWPATRPGSTATLLSRSSAWSRPALRAVFGATNVPTPTSSPSGPHPAAGPVRRGRAPRRPHPDLTHALTTARARRPPPGEPSDDDARRPARRAVLAGEVFAPQLVALIGARFRRDPRQERADRLADARDCVWLPAAVSFAAVMMGLLNGARPLLHPRLRPRPASTSFAIVRRDRALVRRLQPRARPGAGGSHAGPAGGAGAGATARPGAARAGASRPSWDGRLQGPGDAAGSRR